MENDDVILMSTRGEKKTVGKCHIQEFRLLQNKHQIAKYFRVSFLDNVKRFTEGKQFHLMAKKLFHGMNFDDFLVTLTIKLFPPKIGMSLFA